MPRILHIESSPRRVNSLTRRVTGELVRRLTAVQPGTQVVVRDLAADPLPHVDDAFVAAMFTPAEARTVEQTAVLALSDALIDELASVDVVVIGAPMFNYSVPSALKAWIDHVVRARRTFQHTADGPVGLLADRPVYVAMAAGGIYEQGTGRSSDFLTPYLKSVLGKIGLRTVLFIRAEGDAIGEFGAREAATRAEAEIDSVLNEGARALGVGIAA